MKRLLNISRSAAVILSVFAFLAACTPDITHYRGRDNWPDDNTPGRNGGHGGKDDGTYRLDYGYANYYGYFYPTSPATDNYLLYLYSGATDKNGKFTKNGVILTLDLLMYESSSLALANGVYSCSDDGEAFTFIPTYSSDDSEFDGSSLYIQTDLDNYRTYAVTGGSVHITRKVTGVYEIEADIKSEAGEYSFIFKGMVDIKDDRQGGDEEPGGDGDGDGDNIPKNVEMSNITKVVAEDWGMVWDGIPCTSYRDYILYFYDKDYKTTNEYTCIEILTEEKFQNALPNAKFDKVVAIGNPDEFVPGVIIAGYSDEDDLAWGTWYCKGGTAWYAASKGSLDMKATENGYKLFFDFVDEDETFGGAFKGSYEGIIEFTVPQTKSGDIVRQPAGMVKRQNSSVNVIKKVNREVSYNRVSR